MKEEEGKTRSERMEGKEGETTEKLAIPGKNLVGIHAFGCRPNRPHRARCSK